jgi:outer membrane protein, adhesin transport system
MVRFVILVVIASLSASPVRGDEAPLLPPSREAGQALRAALAKAVPTHPAVQEALAGVDEAAQTAAEARAGLRPQIDVELAGDRSLSRDFANQDENVLERIRPRQRLDLRATGQQLLWDFGATRARIGAGLARTEAARADVGDVAASVSLEAIGAWLDVVVARHLVTLGEAFLGRHQEILADTQLRFDQGVGTQADVARVESYLADAEGKVARFQRDLVSARARYLEYFETEPPAEISRAVPPATGAANADEAVSLGVMRNSRVLRAAALTSGASQDVSAAEADRLPRLSAAMDATQFDFLDGTDYDVRARLVTRYPLFTGGARTARVEQAKARLRRAEDGEERVRERLATDIRIAYEDVTTLTTQLATLKRAYDANVRTRGFFLEQFKVARGSLLDLLQAEQDTFEAQVTYVNGIVELDAARYLLLARTGELLPALDIVLPVTPAQGE